MQMAEKERRVLQKIYDLGGVSHTEWVMDDALQRELGMEFRELNKILIDLETEQRLIGAVNEAVWLLPAGVRKVEEQDVPPPSSASPNSAQPIEILFSYSHEDESMREQLEKHVALMKRQDVITGWHDRMISAGEEWASAIDKHINSARMILLLVSSDFLNSDYCYNIEMKRAMARHEAGEARVIPIILRPCDWHEAPFGKLQALPKNAKPVTTWENQDEAFFNVAQGIRKVAEELSVNP